MRKFFLLFYFLSFLFFVNDVFPKEHHREKMICFDNKPLTMGWVYDKKGGWRIHAFFKEAIVECFFHQAPSAKNGLSLSKTNMPYKIEFTHLPTSQFLWTEDISYGQTNNGDVYFASTLNGIIENDLLRFSSVIVSIDENLQKETSSVCYVFVK